MQNLQELGAFQKAVSSSPQLIVHFWAAWCEPCAVLDKVLEQVIKDHPSLRAIRVEAEEATEISEKYQVSVVPYFVFINNGQILDTLEGAEPSLLVSKASALAKHKSILATEYPAPTIQDRIAALIKKKPVMLFMKGNAGTPRCGFSSKVVEVLNSIGADYGTFDILSDEDVRQGLKEYSNWPTYPQLYVQGELLGGHDIIMELAETGELRSELSKVGGLKDSGKAALINRLEALLNSSPVLLVMKGDPDSPRCGFSRKVVDALRADGIDFKSFDILSDEEIRQGLKEYSNWPTYPQLYVKGELVGGCDIVLEMADAGELKETINEMVARI